MKKLYTNADIEIVEIADVIVTSITEVDDNLGDNTADTGGLW